MKISKLAAGLLLVVLAAPAVAQSIPDDARCLALSSLFSKAATGAPQRASAAQALVFYVGRLDARADARAITNALHALGGRIDPKAAPAEMSACAARVVIAQQNIQAAFSAAQRR